MLPSAFKHTLFIIVPLIAILAVLPGVYQNHLLLFNFVIFLILAQGVNIIYGFYRLSAVRLCRLLRPPELTALPSW